MPHGRLCYVVVPVLRTVRGGDAPRVGDSLFIFLVAESRMVAGCRRSLGRDTGKQEGIALPERTPRAQDDFV